MLQKKKKTSQAFFKQNKQKKQKKNVSILPFRGRVGLAPTPTAPTPAPATPAPAPQPLEVSRVLAME
jgi:hypothetical protein